MPPILPGVSRRMSAVARGGDRALSTGKEGAVVTRLFALAVPLVLVLGLAAGDPAPAPWVVYEGSDGPGKGKHIVFVSGDEEYRSEEALPQLAKVLARHHGFKCTVLFAIDAKTGTINPNVNNNIPGL